MRIVVSLIRRDSVLSKGGATRRIVNAILKEIVAAQKRGKRMALIEWKRLSPCYASIQFANQLVRAVASKATYRAPSG
jgi:hypothetical protein